MNEAETRAEYIEKALRQAGWGEIEGSRIRREFPISIGRLVGNKQRTQPEKADYVLQYRNRNLAVIEAKKRDAPYTQGVGQAKRYAQKLQIRYTYSTNGLQIYGIDMHQGIEGDVEKYPTPNELWQMVFGSQAIAQPATQLQNNLLATSFDDRGGTWQPRYYQELAITKVVEAIAQNKTRILLTHATGTGKTAIAFQIAWKLFHAKWNIHNNGQRRPRILFLADRNILADQAFNAFNTFEEEALIRISHADIKKKGKVPKNGSVFFTIFQTFMSGQNDSPYFGEYEKDFFDFIIIDECHRGGAKDESTWRAILEHFSPAVQLGLTATPKRTINVDTYNYFGEPVYIYSLKDGINDGFLTPFKIKQITTNIDEYIYTPDDTIIEGEIEEGKVYTENEINNVLEIKEREQYRVKLFMDMINQDEKTLVFCANQKHALAIRDLINQYAKSKNPNYCHRVTADDGSIGEQHLRDFQNNEKTIPTILTTSQKLSTGVDAPEVKNIVLLRPVNSIIEFKQIIGRGTRLFDGKDYFTVYDFVKAHHHFADPEWDGEPLAPEPSEETTNTPKVCKICGQTPCICPPPELLPCELCGKINCECGEGGRKIIRVKLADGKERQLQNMVNTSFWSPDGTPISAEEFLATLFGKIPELFKNENELRQIWSKPDTRKKLLEELAENGFAKAQLVEFQKVLNAENSDLYDVLAYIAFHSKMVNRAQRATQAKIYLGAYNPKQQEFLNFVLQQYVQQGVDELDDAKISDLLVLKYHAIADAKKELGDIASIRNTFIDFQTYLYDNRAAS